MNDFLESLRHLQIIIIIIISIITYTMYTLLKYAERTLVVGGEREREWYLPGQSRQQRPVCDRSQQTHQCLCTAPAAHLVPRRNKRPCEHAREHDHTSLEPCSSRYNSNNVHVNM